MWLEILFFKNSLIILQDYSNVIILPFVLFFPFKVNSLTQSGSHLQLLLNMSLLLQLELWNVLRRNRKPGLGFQKVHFALLTQKTKICVKE